ncbi:TauD/TfdA family dioxygenase [Archangium lipolyticum]|uniref:TauD/TfdA family dioxygenase n=1 Tax=Archangium lipolyticum TaxID=2970465 RepID=UPI00214A1B57|nr:TauD/TfdA family dioxygenase [Archangium lipolyticum]
MILLEKYHRACSPSSLQGPPVSRYRLSEAELEAVEWLIDEVARTARDGERAWLDACRELHHLLPLPLLQSLSRYRRGEAEPVWVVSGLPIDQEGIGPTPEQYPSVLASPTLRETTWLALIASAIGEPFTFRKHIQGARMVHDIMPLQGSETQQLASSSRGELFWHTEDAFHAFCCDFLGLLCLRNPTSTPTTLAVPAFEELTEAQRGVLFEKRFYILPDETVEGEEVDFPRELVSVLFGNRKHPFLRADPLYTQPREGDVEAWEALNAFFQVIERSQFQWVLMPGDLCLIDNYRAVHGRKPFRARFDGNDRWLKRIFVTADLRKSSSLRKSLSSPWIEGGGPLES